MQGVPSRRRRQRRANVGVAEVITLEKQGVVEKQGVAGRCGERIGEAIADVQLCPMAASAEAAKRVDGDLHQLQRDTDDVEAAVAQQKFDRSHPCGPRWRTKAG